jgi:hypothetical protein
MIPAPPAGLGSGMAPELAQGSRPIGATGVADQGWESRSFSACGAPPGFPPLACFEANSPTRRDTTSNPAYAWKAQHYSREAGVIR